jgi:hypothetical protein
VGEDEEAGEESGRIILMEIHLAYLCQSLPVHSYRRLNQTELFPG